MSLKIISGGQTGVDVLALEIAHKYGISTGGCAPLGYRTDIGPNLLLKTKFNLSESSEYGYPHRTYRNVVDSDITVLFGNLSSSGCKLTISLCKKHKKPYLENPNRSSLIDVVTTYKIVNFAGNRLKNIDEELYDQIRGTIEYALLIYKLL